MASFKLVPCKLRDNKLVEVGEIVEFDWAALKKKFASQRMEALHNLRRIQRSGYLGLVKSDTGPKCFFLLNDNRGNVIDWLLKKEPSFETRLIEVYKVEDFQWDDQSSELSAVDRPTAG